MAENQEDMANGEQRMVYSSSILFEKQPIEAMEALVIRRQQAKQINKDLAEWFTAYGRLRLHYVDELKKIHKRGETLFTDSSSPTLQTSKLDALGLCSPMWSDVLKNLDNEITLFDQSTRKMGRDMIAPLRLFTRNNDTNLVEMDQLIEVASDIKNAKSSGQPSDHFEDEWSRKAPYFFEIFENYDYQRFMLLKDVFLKYQTDVGDVVAQFKKDNETGLEHVLNFNIDDEINRFSQDVIATSLPIENIKLDMAHKSRTSTDGFTATAAAAVGAGAGAGTAAALATANHQVSRRHSSLLSPHRFHRKKTSEHDQQEHPNESTTSIPHTDSKSSKRLSSNNSMFSSNTSSTFGTNNNANNDKKKEKASVRSKFGSIFKGRKKNGKDVNYAPPSTIHEPDNSSINTATTHGSSRVTQTPTHNYRQRNYSHASSSAQNQSSVKYNVQTDDRSYQTPNHDEHPTEDHIKSSPTPAAQNRSAAYPYRASMEMTDNTKQLPSFPLADSKNINQTGKLSEASNLRSQQQPILESKSSESGLYEAMRPTKRSDSLSSSNIQPAAVSASSDNTVPAYTPPVTAGTGMTSIPQGSYGMENIPETAALVNNSLPSPPPPPTSRKHIPTSDMGINNSTSTVSSVSRQPHGDAPVPPIQRRSMLIDPQQQLALQPAATGTHQSESTTNVLAKNTTGGGGLVGGQIMHPSLTTPGLNTSIVELFNATFKDGTLVRSNAIGEIAFSFIVDNETKKLPSEISLQISSKKNIPLPNFMVNTMFLQQSATSPGIFSVSDPAQISMRTVGGLKYMLNNPTPPIVITPIWKHEETQSTVIISIKPVPELDTYLTSESLTLSNLMVSVSITGALVSTAATKPPGSLNKEKGRVTWISPNPIVFNSAKKEERFVARFITNQLAKESDTGVQARFNVSNEDGAGRIDFLNTDFQIKARGENIVEDPFGDGVSKQVDDWSEVPTLKSLIAGSYSGHC